MPQKYLVPPGPQRLLARPRLWTDFGGTGELTLIWGHRGSGKTSAVVDWVRNGPPSDEAVVLWLDGESRPWGRRAFRAWLVQALRVTLPETDRHVPSPKVDDESSFGQFARRAAATGRPLVVVVDGVRRMRADLLEDLLDLASSAAALRVVVIVEDQLEFESRRMVRSAHVASLGPTDLAFTPQEVERFIGGGGAAPLRGYGKALYALTSGDPLVTMALVRELGRMEAPIEPSRLSLGIVRDVVGMHGVDSVPSAALLLRRLGFAHRPTLRLAERIAGDIPAADVLCEMEAKGVGAWSPIDAEPRFHLSPAAARMLADEVPMAAEESRRIHHLVGDWAAEHGDLVNAVGSALDLGEEEVAGSLIAGEIGRFVTLSHDSLAYLLARGAGRSDHQGPWRSFLAAISYSRHVGLRMVSAPRLASHREDGTAGGELTGNVVAGYTAAVALRAAGDVSSAVDAGPFVDSWDDDPGTSSLVTGALTERALVLAASGERDGARAELERGIESSPHATPLLVFHARILRGALEAQHGILDGARALVRDVGRSTRAPSWSSDAVAVPYRVAAAWLAMEDFDIERASGHLENAAALADPVEFWTLVAEPLGRVAYLSSGAGAWEWLEGRKLPPGATLPWRVSHARAWALRDLSRAEYERGLSRFAGLESLPETVLERARIHLYAGDVAAARHLTGVAASRGMPSPRLRSDHAAISAAIELRTRENAGIRDALDMIADVDRRGLPSFPLALLPPREREVLRTLSGSGPRRGARAGGGAAADRVRLVAGLSVTDLEILKLLAEGHKLIQVAKIRVVSINTIKSRVRILYRKLGVAGRGEAVEVAGRLGLLPEEDDGAGRVPPGSDGQFPAAEG